MTSTNTLPPAGMFRRLGALFYDALIVLAIEMMAGGVVVALLHALMAMGLFSHAGYADVSDFLTNHPILESSLYLLSRSRLVLLLCILLDSRRTNSRHARLEASRAKQRWLCN